MRTRYGSHGANEVKYVELMETFDVSEAAEIGLQRVLW